MKPENSQFKHSRACKQEFYKEGILKSLSLGIHLQNEMVMQLLPRYSKPKFGQPSGKSHELQLRAYNGRTWGKFAILKIPSEDKLDNLRSA